MKPNNISSLVELKDDYTDFSSSLVCPETSIIEKYPNGLKAKYVTLPFLLFPVFASISSDINIDREYINPSSSSYNIFTQEEVYETNVLYSFISNLINNSEDLDGQIIDMVNEEFWDLI